MKKLILALGIVLTSVFSVSSQDKAAAGNAADKMVNTITKVCTLTADQVTKIKPMVATFVQTRAENKEKYANDPDGLKTANDKNKATLKSQLVTVLTADQQAKYEQYLKEQQEKKEQNKEKE